MSDLWIDPQWPVEASSAQTGDFVRFQLQVSRLIFLKLFSFAPELKQTFTDVPEGICLSVKVWWVDETGRRRADGPVRLFQWFCVWLLLFDFFGWSVWLHISWCESSWIFCRSFKLRLQSKSVVVVWRRSDASGESCLFFWFGWWAFTYKCGFFPLSLCFLLEL